MKKQIIALIAVGFLPILLSGCGKEVVDEKKDFFIDTVLFKDFDQQVFVTKPGRVAGSEEIVVTSQVAGRVKSILQKDGNVVGGGQPILSIADSVANYGLQVQRVKNALDRSLLQYDQTKITLDKSLSDVAAVLDVAENTYAVTQQTTEQSLKKAQLDFSNAGVQTENLQLQFPLEKTNLLNLMDSILHQVDTYLGLTDKYKSYNDSYEIYLGAKNISQKTQTETLLYKLYSLRNEVVGLSSDTTDSAMILSGVDVLQKGYDTSKQVLDGMREILINTIVSSSFPQATIDGYKASIDGLNASLQMSKSSFIGYRKQIIPLLSQGGSGVLVEMNKEQADIVYNTTLINSQNALFNSEIGIRNAKTSYDTLIKNKDVQLGLSENGISDSTVAYQDALSKFNKLSVRAPIAGVIGTVLVDVGQEIAPGTPLFSLSNNKNQTIEVYVTAEERGYLALDQIANVTYAKESFTGTILSVSSVADKNTLYKIVVGLDRPVSLLGDVASVQLPVSLPYQVLPINIVTPISQNKGFVWLYQGTGMQKQPITLGRVWDSYIEILSGLSDGMSIITTDVSSFDPSKFIIKKK